MNEEVWKYFVKVGLWPRQTVLDPRGWMSNFTSEEQPLASRLLGGFTYFSQELVVAMFRAAFKNLSQVVLRDRASHASTLNEWREFVDSVIIVRVAGQVTSEADSGYIFSRLSRDVLGIGEERLMSPRGALECLLANPRRNVVFVDDFVGSGEQFVDMWKELHDFPLAMVSFETLIARGRAVGAAFYYIPLICAERGRVHIEESCPQLRLLPVHILAPSYGALAVDSVIWREDMAVEGPKFVERVSGRAGLRDMNGDDGCWRGYRGLGLTLAFGHGVPDATLPIFTASSDRWKPLIKSAAS